MTKREMKVIESVKAKVSCEIADFASHGGLFAGPLASEGYAGGYRDALEDVLIFLDAGVRPGRRHYWD